MNASSRSPSSPPLVARLSRTRIKFCGMTRVEDVQAATALGVDAIGVVLTERSKRFAGIERAVEIRMTLPPFVDLVALFMDDQPGFIAEAVAAVQPDLLQFHGLETAEECVRYRVPYLKAVAMGGGVDPAEVARTHPAAAGFLLDGHAAGEQGGSGRTFDWSAAVNTFAKPVVLAGGLTAHNVGAAIRALRPHAVDVSGGIESTPGVKDATKLRAFVEAVRAADAA
ncbi:MAG: phosphoribosylanthranilate isomerase [Rudaea sp.]|uniref:phosphoribosylanthranilate isomerase n=1 Tax=Rudaea sp. TaxID=2136325 RepID=UPI0039E4F136